MNKKIIHEEIKDQKSYTFNVTITKQSAKGNEVVINVISIGWEYPPF